MIEQPQWLLGVVEPPLKGVGDNSATLNLTFRVVGPFTMAFESGSAIPFGD